MTDYLDTVLTAAERVIGTARHQDLAEDREEDPGLPPPNLAIPEHPATAAPPSRRGAVVPAENCAPSLSGATLRMAPAPSPAESNSPVRHPREVRADNTPPSVETAVERPIALATIETQPERGAEASPRPVSRTREPGPPPPAALSWSRAWMDTPEPRLSRAPERAVPDLPRRPADLNPASSPELGEGEPVRSAPELAPDLSPSHRPAANEQWTPAMAPVVAAPSRPPPPAAAQGLVIHNLEIRVQAPEGQPPPPPEPAQIQTPATAAGAWVSAARRYAGRA